MRTWAQKDPDAVLAYEIDWNELIPGTVIDNATLEVLSGSARVKAGTLTWNDGFTRALIEGGVDAENTVFLARIYQADTQIGEETVVLPIVSTTTPVLTPGYTAPGVGQFQARFPRFELVNALAITQALNEAAGMVDESWSEGDFAIGRMLWAAHILTLDGHGSGAEAQAFAQGAGGFQRMKSGSLELQRFESAGSGTGPEATAYGRRWLDLARRNRGGPLVVGAASEPCSPVAFDCC